MRLNILMVVAALLLAHGAAQAVEVWREPVSGMEFVAIPKGCFQMGLPGNAFQEEDRLFRQRIKSEMPQHEVCLDGFWLGRYEVRSSEWQKIMGESYPARADDAPVAGVSWEQALTFARRLTELSDGKRRFRLPTEAEWEYACRAGEPALTNRLDRNNLDDVAWYSSAHDFEFSGDRHKEVQPVGRKMPNKFGLHDMLGNVWEWVEDSYHPDAYARHALYSPKESRDGDKHGIRGGGLRTDKIMTRCTARAWYAGEPVNDTLGLRLVREQ